jgi:hypothetical protein
MRVPSPLRTASELLRFAEQVTQAFRDLARLPFIDGVQVDVPPAAAAAVVRVEHRLGRVPRGWLLLSVERASAVTGAFSLTYRTGDARDGRALELWAPTSFVSATLWVW